MNDFVLELGKNEKGGYTAQQIVISPDDVCLDAVLKIRQGVNRVRNEINAELTKTGEELDQREDETKEQHQERLQQWQDQQDEKTQVFHEMCLQILALTAEVFGQAHKVTEESKRRVSIVKLKEFLCDLFTAADIPEAKFFRRVS